MFVIGEVVIEEQIVRERFACDVEQCKGACCTLPGGRGAPLMDDELGEIERAYPEAMKYLTRRHRDVIAGFGMFEGNPGSYTTACVGGRECVFVFFEQGVARCALETAFHRGETTFRKPISCQLFPLRIANDRGVTMGYEQISECRAGRIRGRREDIPLHAFLKDAIVQFNTTGEIILEMAITLTGFTATTLAAADFIL